MSRLAEQGFGIVFVSSELKEVMAMSDRILVLSKGEVVAEFEGDRATEKELVDASAVGHGPSATATASEYSPSSCTVVALTTIILAINQMSILATTVTNTRADPLTVLLSESLTISDISI